MSKLFYDHLVDFEKLETAIKNLRLTHEHRIEIWSLVDKITNHRIITLILGNLDHKHHHSFLKIVSENPHSELVINFAQENSDTDIKKLITRESELLTEEILSLLEF